MLLTISIACHNRVDVTRQCIESLKLTDLSDTEFIFSDNGSSDDTVEVVRSSGLENLRIVRYGINLGFGEVHNEALKLANGEYFCVLNNDIFIKDRGWVDRLLAPFRADSKVAVVGIDDTPCSLKVDGSGFTGPKKEYVDGGCVVAQTEMLRKFGLFSPALRKCYYEDADLSLRFRQMGYKLSHVPLTHIHHRGSTARTIPDAELRGIIERNKMVFTRKWDRYLQSRTFTNAVLIKIHSIGVGDIVAMTPLLEALRKEYPSCDLIVNTTFPDVFENNPYVTSVGGMNEKRQRGFDRVIDVTLQGHDPTVLLAQEAANKVGVKISSCVPKLFLTKGELEEAHETLQELSGGRDASVIVCGLMMSRTEWHGRNWDIGAAAELVDGLNEMGFITVEVGRNVPSTGKAQVDLVNKTSLRGLFAVMACSDVFVGIDSAPLHVAQAFSKPSFVLFGATEPTARVVDFTHTSIIRRNDLACVGCYHKSGAQPINKCRLGNEECMNIKAKDVLDVISGEKDAMTMNVAYLQGVLRK